MILYNNKHQFMHFRAATLSQKSWDKANNEVKKGVTLAKPLSSCHALTIPCLPCFTGELIGGDERHLCIISKITSYASHFLHLTALPFLSCRGSCLMWCAFLSLFLFTALVPSMCIVTAIKSCLLNFILSALLCSLCTPTSAPDRMQHPDMNAAQISPADKDPAALPLVAPGPG